MTLYLKYRPKNLDELDLLDVGESLKKIVSKEKIPHAFLFAGPKGTGKTSAARILAKILNCTDLKEGTPCEKCDQCHSISKGSDLDVIEMDAASHRGIDDVRLLRDAVKLSPVSAAKKIYIIDEAHMLTTEASNALLKTLEEPPEHVVFILATTNPEKLIDTIRSRTTFIPFRKASSDEIVNSLRRVVKGEKMKTDDETLGVIAEAADGSFRDGIKILEQLISEEKELTKGFLEEYLFRKKAFDLNVFVTLLASRDTKSLLQEIEALSIKGVSADLFTENLLKKLRNGLLAEVGIGEGKIHGFNKKSLVTLIDLFSEAFQDIANSPIEELPLEIAVIKWCGEVDSEEPQIIHTEEKPFPDETETKGHSTSGIQVKEEIITSEVKSLPTDLPIGGGVDDSIWKNILALIKPINASIEALLRAAKPMTYDGKILTLGVYYKFHKERLEDIRHRKVLEDIVGKVLGSVTKVCCVLVEPPPRQIITETKVETVLTEGSDKDIIKAAEEIFSN